MYYIAVKMNSFQFALHLQFDVDVSRGELGPGRSSQCSPQYMLSTAGSFKLGFNTLFRNNFGNFRDQKEF